MLLHIGAVGNVPAPHTNAQERTFHALTPRSLALVQLRSTALAAAPATRSGKAMTERSHALELLSRRAR
jgi:hypothetical protein